MKNIASLILCVVLFSGCAQNLTGLTKDERAAVIADRKSWSDLGQSVVQAGVAAGLSRLDKSDGKTIRR